MTDLQAAIERVTAFLDHLDTRPNALIHNQGKTLSRADLRAILGAVDEAREVVGALLTEYREWDAPRGGYAETHPAYKARTFLAKLGDRP